MRLIDADALIEFIDAGHLRHPSELCFSELDVVNMLNHAPIAYDVEKVVAELEERRANCDCKYCKHNKTEKQVCTQDCTDALIDDLFDIVRKGGVE